MKPLMTLALTLLLLPSFSSAWDKGRKEAAAGDKAPRLSKSEIQERRVDHAALESQLLAISKLKALIRSHQGSEQEAFLLFKLGDAQRRAGSMQFRIAHGTTEPGKHARELAAYKAFFAQSTTTFTNFIKRFPRSSDVPVAYFLKARSQHEAGNIEAASRDYLYLVHHFPKADDVVSAYMSLAEISMDHNRWDEASTYLGRVEKNPDHPFFPHALYKQAWCQYNMKHVGRALSYLERHLEYYEKRAKASSDRDIAENSDSKRLDDAFRENSIQDAALFFLEGFEQKLPNFDVPDAHAYFKRVVGKSHFGAVAVRYARLLRAHGHVQALDEWRTLLLDHYPTLPASFDVIVICYEDQLNKRDYAGVIRTAKDLESFARKSPTSGAKGRAEQLLLTTAKDLQALISRNKKAEGVAALSSALARVYESFTRMVDEKDSRIPKIHYNLAESLFEIGEFETATLNYRWVVEHSDWTNKDNQKELANASLRAISSRYESLRKSGIIPKDLKPRLFSHNASPLAAPVSEWIAWIDTHIKK